MTFAQKLRELRQAAGLSEAKLAEQSGVSFGAVHNYGLGIRQPTFAAVARLARALGVTCNVFADCDDVIGGESPPEGPNKTPTGESAPKAVQKPRRKREE